MANKKSAKKSAVKKSAPANAHRSGDTSSHSSVKKLPKGKAKNNVYNKRKGTTKPAPVKVKKVVAEKPPVKSIDKQKIKAVKLPKDRSTRTEEPKFSNEGLYIRPRVGSNECLQNLNRGHKRYRK